MTEKSQRCIDFVLKMEGDGKADAKGARFGIDPRYHPAIDVATITREQAINFYFHSYWDKHRLEERSEAMGLVLLDYFVNSGAGPARFSRLPIGCGPMDVLRDRGRYMLDLALGFIASNPEKVEYWTDSLAGWMHRIADNARAVRALEGTP